MGEEELTRRKFISASGVIVSSLLAGGNLMTYCGSTKSPTEKTSSDTYTIDLSDPANEVLQKTDGAKKFDVPGQTLPVIVIRLSETEVIALSSKCTHQGCEVDNPSNGIILCPCHGSEFDLHGDVLRGPAQLPLHQFQSKFEGNIITLTI